MENEHFEKLKREIEMTEDPDHLDFNGRDFGYKIGKFGVPFCVGAVVLGKFEKRTHVLGYVDVGDKSEISHPYQFIK